MAIGMWFLWEVELGRSSVRKRGAEYPALAGSISRSAGERLCGEAHAQPHRPSALGGGK